MSLTPEQKERARKAGERILEAVLEESDLDACPKCGGAADNGHDRCLPPNPYYCRKCELEYRKSIEILHHLNTPTKDDE